MKLTDSAIRNATANHGKSRKIFDGGGLYLEVSASGKKGWRLKYRFGGKEKRISLGIYPDVSLKYAREKREEYRTMLAKGTDPSQQRKVEKLHALPVAQIHLRPWPMNGLKCAGSNGQKFIRAKYGAS